MAGLCLTALLISPANVIAATNITEQLEQLRSNARNLHKAQADFSATQRNNTLSASEASDYASWIEQLEDLLRQDCNRLVELSPTPLPADLPCEQLKSAAASAAGIDLKAEQTDAERTAIMIGQLNGSLGEFDERLLREQDRVKAKTPRTDNSGGGASGGDGDSTGEYSDAMGDAQTDPAESSSQGTEQSGESSQTAGQGSKSGDNNRKGANGQATPDNRGDTPDDIPDGRDDDVVARQLREAAETEQDPVLKEKLWDEYRRYKAGS